MRSIALLFTLALLLSLACYLPPSAKAEGTVIVWSIGDSPVYLNSNITIAEGETLVIEPGVQVICKTYNWRINIYGGLEAKGTPDKRISFSGTYDIANQWYGIYLYSDNNILECCNFSNSVYGVWAQGSGQVLTDCIFKQCNLGTYLKGENNRIEGCLYKDLIFLGVSLWGSGNTVNGSRFENCPDAGVFMRDNERNQITHCTFANMYPNHLIWNGVRLFHSSRNVISNCTFERLYYGANLENQSNGNRIVDNVFRNCTYGNILFSFVENANGSVNSDDNLLAYNRYLGNYNYGMIISGKNNLIIGNDIRNSSIYGIYFLNESTEGNLIYLNNFINNAKDAFDLSGNNTYNDLAKEGNYWSEANMTDKNRDGIGDSAYGLDNYPLMDPLIFENGRLEDYDTDGDGLKDYRDPDDDNDGFSDIEERQSGYESKDKDSHPPKDPYSIENYLLVIFFAMLIIATICLFAFFARKKAK